jgi:hypothetical protein
VNTSPPQRRWGISLEAWGLAQGELTTELTYPYSELAAVTASESSNLFTEELPSPPIFSPSDILVDAETEEATPALVRGEKKSSGGADSTNIAALSSEKKDLPPNFSPLKEAQPALETHYKEGRSKSTQCARDRVGSERLAFGEDVAMDRVLEFSERAVVGRVRGKNLGLAFLKGWVTKTWLPELSKMPHIRLLTRGWFAFVFTNSEEVDWVLKKVWCLADTPTILKRWTPAFDAKRERVDEEPIWVRLPGFPMQYWNTHRFAAIGNLLGSFLEADMSFEETGLMTVARILVKIDLKKGLLQEITIDSAAGTFVQTLDYEGIPFRCHRCHIYGHGMASCPLPFKGMIRKSKGSNSSLSPPKKKLEVARDSEGFKGLDLRSAEEPTTKSQSLEHRTSLGTGTLLSEGADLDSTPTTRAPTQPGRYTLGMSPLDVTSCTSFPFSSLFCHSLEANKGVPPPNLLRRCSLHNFPSLHCTLSSSLSVIAPSLISSSFHLGRVDEQEPPQTNPPTLKPTSPILQALSTVPPLDTPSTLALADTLLPNHLAAQATPSASTDSSSEDSRVRYHLRNRSVVKEHPSDLGSQLTEGRGLGSIPRTASVGKGRGRKSHLYLAQDRARIDLATGRQSSIEWALREKPPLEGVSP